MYVAAVSVGIPMSRLLHLVTDADNVEPVAPETYRTMKCVSDRVRYHGSLQPSQQMFTCSPSKFANGTVLFGRDFTGPDHVKRRVLDRAEVFEWKVVDCACTPQMPLP